MRIPPSLFDIPSRPLADAFNIRYSTKYYDAESDLYYYGYRYYAPGLHRWLTRDPIAEEGGVNLYGFCENASVFKYDSDGLLSYVIDVGVSKFSGDVFLDQSQEKFEDQFALLKQVLDSVYKIPDQAFDNSREKGRVKFNGTQFTGTRLEFASKIKRELTSQWLFANSAGYKTTMRKLRDLKEKAIAEYDVVALLVHGRISEIDGEYVVQSNFNGERKPTLSVRGIIDKKIGTNVVYISCRQTTRRQDAAENRGIESYCIDSVVRGNSTDTVTYERNGLVKTKITGCDLDIYPIRIRRMVDGAIVN